MNYKAIMSQLHCSLCPTRSSQDPFFRSSASTVSPIPPNKLIKIDILHLGETCRYLHSVQTDQHFWRQRTFETFRLPPQPIRLKGWLDLFRRLSTARALTWGSNQFGRLGHSYAQIPSTLTGIPTRINVPTPVDDLNEAVVDLGCGGWSTWALTSSGKVYGWGKVLSSPFVEVDVLA